LLGLLRTTELGGNPLTRLLEATDPLQVTAWVSDGPAGHGGPKHVERRSGPLVLPL